MTIYQIHECSGEYEDYRDIIVGSYLNKDKAIAKMEELKHIDNERRVRAALCSECPIDDVDIMSENLDIVVRICSKYCSDAKITEDRFGYGCDNYHGYWDETTYEIEEVEVEE